mmetsp:Transcript_4353/g.15062  ORF Transcript_4353/g.15062 Transcript_4353/m.15062 type:complete len:457 (+) Transcript_4353:2745-4115(+)
MSVCVGGEHYSSRVVEVGNLEVDDLCLLPELSPEFSAESVVANDDDVHGCGMEAPLRGCGDVLDVDIAELCVVLLEEVGGDARHVVRDEAEERLRRARLREDEGVEAALLRGGELLRARWARLAHLRKDALHLFEEAPRPVRLACGHERPRVLNPGRPAPAHAVCEPAFAAHFVEESTPKAVQDAVQSRERHRVLFHDCGAELSEDDGGLRRALVADETDGAVELGRGRERRERRRLLRLAFRRLPPPNGAFERAFHLPRVKVAHNPDHCVVRPLPSRPVRPQVIGRESADSLGSGLARERALRAVDELDNQAPGKSPGRVEPVLDRVENLRARHLEPLLLEQRLRENFRREVEHLLRVLRQTRKPERQRVHRRTSLHLSPERVESSIESARGVSSRPASPLHTNRNIAQTRRVFSSSSALQHHLPLNQTHLMVLKKVVLEPVAEHSARRRNRWWA